MLLVARAPLGDALVERLGPAPEPVPLPDLAAMIAAEPAAGAAAQVRGIVERRCAVCHGGNDAPCRLKPTSPEGLARVASPEDVCDAERLRDAAPTRLDLDATTEAERRGPGFHPVTAREGTEDPASSLMARLLAPRRAAPFAPGTPPSDTTGLDRDRGLVRPKPDEMQACAPPRPIATRRPYDDAGGPFRHGPVPFEETITAKNRLVHEIGPARRARLADLFLSPGRQAGEPPGWGAEAGGNPFLAFAAIPAEARYRFLLGDALFLVRSFIRGPVRRGQVATE
ncbi:MAG: fatty acid cis/trans isomerase [Pseudomonadota bacterium]|nr:fatty acid cis/trans isomerase [Pseudomonadota bacterium]